MKTEILSSKALDVDADSSLRPNLLNEFVGQEHIKSNLSVFIKAAQNRNESLDHTLFYGPPGLGKTSLANIISKEMGVNFKATSGPTLSKAADLAGILTNLQQNDVKLLLEKSLNSKIEINQEINKSLLGGIIIKYDSQLIDFSVYGALNKIEKIITHA